MKLEGHLIYVVFGGEKVFLAGRKSAVSTSPSQPAILWKTFPKNFSSRFSFAEGSVGEVFF